MADDAKRANAAEILNAAEIKRFLMGRPMYAFEPTTRARVAVVEYEPNGVCATQFEAGNGDNGIWGIDGDTYWTKYRVFRDGAKNVFYLQWVAPDVAQAYHEDGTRAFLQSKFTDLRDTEFFQPIPDV